MTEAHPTTAAPWHTLTRIHIQAPSSVVWSLITDFSTYGDWNGYTPEAKIIERSPANPDPNRTNPVPGDLIYFHCTYKDGSSGPGRDRVQSIVPGTESEDGVYRAHWIDTAYPRWSLFASRQQSIWDLPESDGGGCMWESDLKIYGPLAYVGKWWTGDLVSDAIKNRAGAGLKRKAEEIAKQQAK
jgi:hypothetical protein